MKGEQLEEKILKYLLRRVIVGENKVEKSCSICLKKKCKSIFISLERKLYHFHYKLITTLQQQQFKKALDKVIKE